MKHASGETLKSIAPLLRTLAEHDELRERAPGTFYRKSNAFLHFHEDPAGIFADVKVDGEWQRLPVNSRREQEQLLRLVAETLA